MHKILASPAKSKIYMSISQVTKSKYNQEQGLWKGLSEAISQTESFFKKEGSILEQLKLIQWI